MDLLIGYTNFDKVVNDLRSFFYDARHFQILYLGSFLLMGIFFLQWNTDYLRYGIIIGVALLVQMVAAFFTTKNYQSYKSALITALGLCLLCKTNLYMTGFIAAAIAIASKFLIRYKNKHIFNPVNFGIVVTIFLTGDAWVSPGQWGSHFVWIFMLGALGFLVLKKVNRIDTSLTFLLVFGGLQFIRTVFYLGWSVDVFIHQVSSGTLMLFTFFMITDPMTTPNHRNGRIVWATCIAVASFLLSNYMYVYAAPIWVLFFASPLVPLFDKLFVAKKYEWNFLNK
ncbi:MAG: RnfABCDGE type electron transport complex subunit D [Chitinophagales bacterium]